ncbi:amino acid adenylation domain-containing protein [Actinoplanes sp. NPDC051470]|uniref:non-ribosomal peptide synthetase n=1 Tax=Actinoplanes sp. NPDC051470 TaxID=3157224 RepID=UPI00342D1F3E
MRNDSAGPPATKESRTRPVLSFAQQRLWFLDQVDPGRAGYLSPRSWLLSGPMDPGLLQEALRVVAERHHPLRTRVVVTGGEPRPVIDPAGSIRLSYHDLSAGSAPAEAAERLVRGLLATPCDLSRGPLLRAILARLGPESWLFHYHVHHIAFDGVSRPIFERELSAAYGALVAGARPPAVPVPLAYGEFAYRQREAIDSPEIRSQLRYWRERLAGVPETLELPTDRPRPAVWTAQGEQHDFTVPAAVTDRLLRVAERHRTGLFTVTMALYQRLLGWYADEADVVVGVPFAGRTDAAVEDAIGFFTNTVAVRTDLAGDPSLDDLTRVVRGAVLDALDHQDVPFERIIDELGVHRRLDRNPLFQHWFELADDSLVAGALRLPGVRGTLVEFPETIVRFDTELHLRRAGGGLAGRLLYAGELFDGNTMVAFAEHYVRLLDAAGTEPDRPLSTLRVLSARQERELVTLGTGPAPAGSTETVDRRFEARVAATPDACAVSEGARRLSYRELDEHAGRLAAVLRSRGAGPESVVAVCLPRGIDLIVALVAVVRAGAAYLPVDPESPVSRVQFLVADARARLVICSPRDGARLEVPAERHVPPGASLPEGPRSAVPEPVRPMPDNALYVVHTSGSSGRPKGVAVTHRTFDNLLRWHLAAYPAGPGDVTAQTASASFDAAGWEIWPALVSGARLDICPDELVRSPDDLVRRLSGTAVTSTFVPTLVAEELIGRPLAATTRLRRLLTGGDLFRPRPTDDPGVPVLNHYGPTENTVVATATGELGAPWPRNSIGRPIAGVSAYVLDGSLRLVPRGVPGELYLGGEGVARGYVHRAALTGGAFLPDPFSAVPGARMYRTGDRVRWCADGGLAYLGRSDHQIKINGYRIEPGEIESALRSMPEVGDAAVVARTTEGRPVLVAYLTAAGTPPTPAGLRAHLRDLLPGYLIPSAFVVLAAFPMTTSGKIDRRRLPDPVATAGTPRAPRNQIEEAVHALWCDVLGHRAIGVDDDFFASGGTSMSATRLVARLQERFAAGVTVRTIFDHRTISEQAAEVERLVADEIAALAPEEIDRLLRAGE